MSRLDSIRKNMLDMSPSELREHIRQIRADRKISKERPAAARKRKVSADKDLKKVRSALDGMTPEQLATLLKGLEGDASKGNSGS